MFSVISPDRMQPLSSSTASATVLPRTWAPAMVRCPPPPSCYKMSCTLMSP